MNPNPPKHANRCIYCGSMETLSDEHIVPFALWGDLVLKKASCYACAAITSEAERQVLRGFMRNWRTVNRSPTRRKKHRPSTIRIRFANDYREWDCDVPAEEAVAFLALPHIQGPSLATSNETSLRIVGFDHQAPYQAEALALLTKHAATKMEAHCDIEPYSYCAMLLKIAFSYAAYLGTDFSKYELFAPEIIIKQPNQAWRYVGADLRAPVHITRGLHSIQLVHRRYSNATYLVGVVSLFSKSGATPNDVILGKPIDPSIGDVVLLPC